MSSWFWYAVVAAVLYGAHQIFTRLAAERIGDGLGGFVVEAKRHCQSCCIWQFFGSLEDGTKNSAQLDLIIRFLTGICVGAGTIAFFLLFQKAVRFRPCRQF